MAINRTVRVVYLYLVSLIALIFILVNAGLLINMGLQTWVFTDADKADYYSDYPPSVRPYLEGKVDADKDLAEALRDNPELTQDQKTQIDNWLTDYARFQANQVDPATRRSAQRQRQASSSLAQLLVAVPVFMYHWRLAKREREA